MKRLALLALAGVLLAGCGGSSHLSKAAYEQRLQADGNAVQKTVAALTKSTPSSLAQFAQRVDAAEKAVKNAGDDNKALVAAFRAIQAALERVKANPAGAQAIVTKLEASPTLKAAERATADLKRKGYKVGVIGAP
jgi:uncharacterized lipoprotein NlpE involved in copper resistance